RTSSNPRWRQGQQRRWQKRIKSPVKRPGDHIRFASFAIETLGGLGPDALSLSSELGGRIAAKTGEPRSTNFFRQRLDVVIQSGNAAAIRGTMVDSARQDDVGSDT